MTKLEQLIEEFCPNGVEFKKIKDVFQRLKGTPITAGKMKEIENPNGEIKIFAGGKTVINANESRYTQCKYYKSSCCIGAITWCD